MFGNYLKVTLNNMLGNKLFTLINLLGLGLGFTCFILISLFVRDELGYDRQYSNADRIYRLSRDIAFTDGSPDLHAAANGPLEAGYFESDFPQIQTVVRLRPWRAQVARDDQAFSEDAAFADSNLFSVFDFQWSRGSPDTALQDPLTVVLTDTLARKYFPGTDPLGQTLMLEGQHPARVTGVIGDLPTNTHLHFTMLVSMTSVPGILGANSLQNPSTNLYHTYALLEPGADIRPVVVGAGELFDRYYGEGTAALLGLTATPLTDIHLYANREGEMRGSGSITAVYAFSAIAVITLLIACFNFMNLATARSTQRNREVGIRLTVGAERSQLIAQFQGEAVCMAVLAMIMALGVVELALPLFNNFVQKDIVLDYLQDTWVLPALAFVTVATGLVSGSYPALYLSSLKPSGALRNSGRGGPGARNFRNVLVVLQFTVATFLLIATATVFLQMQFARNIDPGFNKEQVVVFETSGREGLGRQWDTLKNRLLQNLEISAVTASNVVPGNNINTNYNILAEGSNGVGQAGRTMPVMLVDYGFFATYEISLVAGRAFSTSFADQNPPAEPGSAPGNPAYILSELAARQLGWSPEEAIGKTFEVTCCGFGTGTVVGVARDVVFESVEVPVAPVVYLVPPEPQAVVHAETRTGLKQASLRISGRNQSDTLAYIDQLWSEFYPGLAVNRRFLEDDFASLYLGTERQNQMLAWFSLLAIVIACSGLYGLVSFNAQRRTKEIGVRKVMGGSVWSIVLLLTNDFSKLVLISNIIAWPLAYVAMERWLENFAYRIDLAPIIFIGSGLIALCIAWVTVGGTAAKAAVQKPVLALRYE